MPVISSATISGMIVILSALSHSVPNGSTNGNDACAADGETPSMPIPSSIPATSAERMIHADFTFKPAGLLAKQKWVT